MRDGIRDGNMLACNNGGNIPDKLVHNKQVPAHNKPDRNNRGGNCPRLYVRQGY